MSRSGIWLYIRTDDIKGWIQGHFSPVISKAKSAPINLNSHYINLTYFGGSFGEFNIYVVNSLDWNLWIFHVYNCCRSRLKQTEHIRHKSFNHMCKVYVHLWLIWILRVSHLFKHWKCAFLSCRHPSLLQEGGLCFLTLWLVNPYSI